MIKSDFDIAYEMLSKPIYALENEEEVANCDDFYDAGLDYNCGAYKIAVIFDDYVLKKAYTGTAHMTDDGSMRYEDDEPEDSCETEVLLYRIAEKRGLERFFAKSEDIGNGIVKQERAEEFVKDREDINSNQRSEVMAFVKQYGLCSLYAASNSEVFYWLMQEYSGKELLKLQDFVDEFDIDDLHSYNVGWCNGKLKLIDYSGTNTATASSARESASAERS